MNKEILIIVPSRSNGNKRENNVDRFIENWLQYTEGYSDLLVSLDEDDEHYYPRRDGVMYTVEPNVRLVPKLNRESFKYKDQYKAIAFFGDDHLIKSPWESKFLEFFSQNNGVGIAYGNDLLQFDKLPTAVCLTSNIINTLGYMVYPKLYHMYADNFWKDLGTATNTLKYFPEVIFEHLHPDIGKASRDNQYNYAAQVVGSDQSVYHNYLYSSEFQDDVNKINHLKQSN
jgi:hypothetical protein